MFSESTAQRYENAVLHFIALNVPVGDRTDDG